MKKGGYENIFPQINFFLQSGQYYLPAQLIRKENCLESELVSGYNTDYSGIIFVFFFLAEYSNIILISTLTSIFFFGGFHLPVILEQYTFINIQSIILALKTCVFCFAFVGFRASLPRIRFDQLIESCGLVLLPIVIGMIIFVPCLLIAFDCSPYPIT